MKDKDGIMIMSFKKHLSRPKDSNIGLIHITPASHKQVLEKLPPVKV